MKQLTRISLIGMMLVIVFALAACTTRRQAAEAATGSTTSALTEAEFTVIAEHAMQGFATGDYTAWSRDWDAAMKGAIKEKEFLTFREQVLASVGEYRSIAAIEMRPSAQKGYIRWSVVANFEQGQVRFDFAFKEDGTQIVGVFPEVMS